MTSVEGEIKMQKAFSQFSSFQRLNELAKNPLDLTRPEVLTPERIRTFKGSACGYHFLYATERVTDDVMQALADLAKEACAIEKMHRMQNGEVINCIKGFPSENRAVLHTATRDFFENQNQMRPAKEAAGMAREEYDKLEAFIQDLEIKNEFSDLIMIGIGGSDLGPYANYLAMEHLKKQGRNLFFINNVDPDNAATVLLEAKLSKCLVVVVTKSGSTLETLANAEFVRARFIEAGLRPEKHFVAVTGEGSPLDDETKYLESFYIWDWIGGRYSSTSMVGGVMLAFAFGFEVYREFLPGANAMDKIALKEDMHENLPLLGALLGIWNHNFLGCPTMALIPYSQSLRRFPAHIQQTSMESNGKHIDRHGNRVDFSTGEIIWGEPGTNAQHSFYQLIHQGTDVIPVEFIGYLESQLEDDFLFDETTSQEKLLSNLFAQAIALASGQQSSNPNKEFLGNRPSHILLGKKLTPYALGALLSYFEHKVAFQGFIWDINSFDQEGVQLGKVLANKIIDRFAAKKRGKSSSPYPLADAFLQELDSL